MIKPFLHERTRSKIQIFSHDPKQWKAAILAGVIPEECPVAYGGTLTDPDGNPNCITLASCISSFSLLLISHVNQLRKLTG